MRTFVIRDKFTVKPTLQHEWGWLIAAAFFLGKVGAGLFLISLAVGLQPGIIVGFVVATVGKGIFHIAYLGRPERFWRAMSRPAASWISRGLWAMAIFAVSGLLFILLPRGGGPLWEVVRFVVVISGLVLASYDGFVMSAPRAIRMWNSAVVPLLAFLYSMLGGITLTIVIDYFFGSGYAIPTDSLRYAELGLIVINLLIVLAYTVNNMLGAEQAARESVALLVKGKYAPFFVGGVIIIGLILPVLIAGFLIGESSAALLVLAIGDLIGHFLVFYLLLLVGMYAPIRVRERRGAKAVGTERSPVTNKIRA